MLKELQGTLSVTQEKLSDREDEVLNLRQALQETTDTQQRRILELERLLELATMQVVGLLFFGCTRLGMLLGSKAKHAGLRHRHRHAERYQHPK